MITSKSTELPTIDFEGKTVIPKNGVYKCPYKCGQPGYAAKTWKTESGFRKHMLSCPKCPSAIKKQQEQQERQRLEYEQRKADAISKVTQQVGDEVWWVQERIIRGEYENWGTRRVRVRYEPAKRFDARHDRIESIDYSDSVGVFFNYRESHFYPWTVCANKEDAESNAKERQKKWDQWCDEAARCR